MHLANSEVGGEIEKEKEKRESATLLYSAYEEESLERWVLPSVIYKYEI